MLNRYSEVQIGTKIIKELSDEQIQDINQAMERSSKYKSTMLIEDGATLVIDDADYNTLIEFNEGDMSVIDNDNVTVSNTNTAVSCEYGKSKRAWFTTSSTRKIKAVIKVPQPKFGWNGKVKTKIKSYKKKRRRWRKRRTHIAAGARGKVGNVSCTGETFFIDNQWTSTKKKRKRVFKWDNPYWASHVVENGGMTGLYRQDGIVKELKLTW